MSPGVIRPPYAIRMGYNRENGAGRAGNGSNRSCGQCFAGFQEKCIVDINYSGLLVHFNVRMIADIHFPWRTDQAD